MLATLLAALKEGVSFGSCRPTVVSQILRVWECGEEPGEVDYRNIFWSLGEKGHLVTGEMAHCWRVLAKLT